MTGASIREPDRPYGVGQNDPDEELGSGGASLVGTRFPRSRAALPCCAPVMSALAVRPFTLGYCIAELSSTCTRASGVHFTTLAGGRLYQGCRSDADCGRAGYHCDPGFRVCLPQPVARLELTSPAWLQIPVCF